MDRLLPEDIERIVGDMVRRNTTSGYHQQTPPSRVQSTGGSPPTTFVASKTSPETASKYRTDDVVSTPPATSELRQSDTSLPFFAPFRNDVQSANNELIVMKRRVQDRDDVVRDLLQRLVQLENENAALKNELDGMVLLKMQSRSTGTNTTYEWATEQHQRTQLVALEEYVRFQEVLLYSEWFGLALAHHRQMFHLIRLDDHMKRAGADLGRGVLLSVAGGTQAVVEPSSSSVTLFPSETLSSPYRSGGMRSNGAAAVLEVSSGASPLGSIDSLHTTPSSATGTALHLLRRLDVLQSTLTDKRTKELGAICLRLNKSEHLRCAKASTAHKGLVDVALEESEARCAVLGEAYNGSIQLYLKRVVAMMTASHQHQVTTLARDSKRMLEFAVSESSAHHRVASDLLATKEFDTQQLWFEQQQHTIHSEFVTRCALLEQERELRNILFGPFEKSAKFTSRAEELLRLHSERLEGYSVALRHSEEPWERRLVESLEVEQRAVLAKLHLSYLSDRERVMKEFHRVQAQDFTSTALEAFQGSLQGASDSHQRVIAWAQQDILPYLHRQIQDAIYRTTSTCRGQLQVVESEHRLRMLILHEQSRDWIASLLTRCHTEQSALASREACTATNRDTNFAVSMAFLSMQSATRNECLSLQSSFIAAATAHVASWQERWEQRLWDFYRFHKSALRLEREECAHRSEVMLYEQGTYFQRHLMPLLLSLREAELNDEYGALFTGVENQTRLIMKRSVEREAGFISYFAEEGLLAAHMEYGVGLVEQHLEHFEALNLFLRDDVRKAQRRVLDKCTQDCRREVKALNDDCERRVDEIRHAAINQCDEARRASSAFWRDVFVTESSRLQASTAQFLANTLLEWQHQQRADLLLYLQRCFHTMKQTHANTQIGLLGFVMSSPVAQLMESMQSATLAYMNNVQGDGKKLLLNVTVTQDAVARNQLEVVELREMRLKQQIAHAEKMYAECRATLGRETHMLQTLKLAVRTVFNEEQEHRYRLLQVESKELSHLLHRTLTVQRYLFTTSRAGGGGAGLWSLGDDYATSTAQQGSTQQSAAFRAALQSVRSVSEASSSIAPSESVLPSTLGRFPIESNDVYRDDQMSASETPRRSEAEELPAAPFSQQGGVGRARSTSLVAVRSLERMKALRGHGFESPEAAPSSQDSGLAAQSVVQKMASAAGRVSSLSPTASQRRASVSSALAFSPSPSTRAAWQAQYQSQLKDMDRVL